MTEQAKIYYFGHRLLTRAEDPETQIGFGYDETGGLRRRVTAIIRKLDSQPGGSRRARVLEDRRDNPQRDLVTVEVRL